MINLAVASTIVLAAAEEKDLSLEYPMQALTLLIVLVFTFVGMYYWAKWNKKKRR